MADRTMEELLQAPTEGYGGAIVILEILSENFEIKMNLLQIWYEKEPPNSILTWNDLVNKFVNQFFPPSKTTHLKNEISRFTQRFEETFGEAWDRFKKMLRPCPHHGFSELTQTDTFYNGLIEQDQESLNAASGGNHLNKTTREALKIIENKSKVRYSRRKSNVSRVNTNSRDNVSKTDDRIDKLADQISNLVEIVNKQVIAPTKAVKKTCVACGGAHAYYDCIATDSNQPSVCAATGSYNQVSPPNRASHQIPPPGFASVQNNPNSGLAYEGPLIPTNSLIEKVDEQNTEEILDKEHSNSSGNAAQVQPLVVPISISEPDVPRTQPKPTIPYPSRDGGVAEDVFVKVGKFHFLTDSVVVDFEADPRVPLILGRSFLRTGHALIDVYGEEITLRVNDKSVTFNLNQTMRYSLTYDDTSVNRVDVIDIACEDFMQDVLDFQYNPKSSSPTLVYDVSVSESDSCKEPIVKSSSPTLTPFGEIVNEDPFQLPPMDLKVVEESKAKSSIEEPPELELKELPSHLEYAFLEDSNKLPVIIAKNLKDVEREALINVLKSHKQAISWKIFDIKVIKLLDFGMIYPISDSPWVSPIHCVPKKEGMTVVANENNKLIPTRLFTGWRVCIDYRKLNDATRKDHFPLPFMDQMIERRKLLSHALTKPSRTDACPLTCVMLQDFSKIDRPMTHLLEKETPFVFSKECIDAFDTLKKKLTEAPILVVPDWNLPFELMCDARDYAIGVVLGQRKMNIVYTNHSALKYLLNKQDAKPRLLRWVILLQEFDIIILAKKGSENLAADHLSRLENPHKDVLENQDINENFPLKTLGSLTGHNTPWAYWVLKHVNFDLKTAGDHRKLQLNELSELRDQAYENSVIYKERTKKLHDSKIKNRIFNVGDQVNGHRVKHYFRCEIPSNVALDLHTNFPIMIEVSRVRFVVPVHRSFTSFVYN
nr:reverse transcriptase domain-containing protein [Tanacetum cinerariifolium]